MQAVILAGGKGTRLRPYSSILPKPLMPIGEIPILEVVIRQLKQNGFDCINLSIGYLGELIESYFRDGSKYGVKLNYFREEIPLGTAGPIKIIKNLDNDFLVMNGDVLTNIDFKGLMKYHKEQSSISTVAVYNREEKMNLGILEIKNNKVCDYLEKPVYSFQVSTGIYSFNRRILDYIPYNQYFDMPDLIKTLIDDGENIIPYQFKGFWLDIGRPDDYENAAKMFEENRQIFI